MTTTTTTAVLAATLLRRLFPSNNNGSNNGRSSSGLHRRIQAQLDLTRLPPAITTIALFHLARLSQTAAFTAQSKGYSLSLLFCLGLAIADTVLDDHAYAASSWVTVAADSAITVTTWTRVYIGAIQALDWRLDVGVAAYDAWLRDLENWWVGEGVLLAAAGTGSCYRGILATDCTGAALGGRYCELQSGLPSPPITLDDDNFATATTVANTTTTTASANASGSRLAGWPWTMAAMSSSSVAPVEARNRAAAAAAKNAAATQTAATRQSMEGFRGHRKHKLSWPWRWTSSGSAEVDAGGFAC